MSQASITKSYRLSSACRIATTYIKSCKALTSANSPHDREWGKFHEFNLTTHDIYIFRNIRGRGVRIKVIKQVVSLQYTTEKLQTKSTNNTWWETSCVCSFPQNNIFMDISPYETSLSFPHLLDYLSGSLSLVKRIVW